MYIPQVFSCCRDNVQDNILYGNDGSISSFRHNVNGYVLQIIVLHATIVMCLFFMKCIYFI